MNLNVRIVSPKGELFNGPAKSVSSKNSAGDFDILPYHANFITLTKNAPIKVQTVDEKEAIFNLPLAIIYARSNKVNIYTDLQQLVTLD